MAISRATIPGSLFSALISSGTPYVRFMTLGKNTIMWDADDLEAEYAEDIFSSTRQLKEKKDGRFASVVRRDRLVKSFELVEGGVEVINLGKLMVIRDAKQES